MQKRVDEEHTKLKKIPDISRRKDRTRKVKKKERRKMESRGREATATVPRLNRIASIIVGTIEAISKRWDGGGESSALST